MAFGVPGWEFSDTADYGPGAAFGTCPSCPPNPKAIRDYDGLELRLNVAPTHGFSGMVSYSYSSLWGNYTGLTTTDQSDGGVTGRNSPDTTRAFDEPFFYFGANGKSTNAPLPTDRPNVIKGLGYYTIPWKHQTTSIGLVENFLQGTPVGSYIDIGGATTGQDFEGTYPFGRNQWVNVTQDSLGNITLGTPYARRTPWFTQSDLSVSHEIKVGDHQTISVEGNALNVLNQRAVVAYFEGMDSWDAETSLSPPNAGCTGGTCNIYDGAAFYQSTETGYNVQSIINAGWRRPELTVRQTVPLPERTPGPLWTALHLLKSTRLQEKQWGPEIGSPFFFLMMSQAGLRNGPVATALSVSAWPSSR